MSEELTTTSGNRLTEIQVSLGAGAKIQSAADAWTLANVYYKSGMAPSSFKNVQQVMVALLAGSELGLPVTTSLRWIMSFGGMPVLYGNGPLGVAMRTGLVEWFDSGYEGEPGTDSRMAWFEIKRKGVEKSVRRTFSLADARKAGLLGKDIWKKYDERMLFHRSKGYAINDLFPDAVGGLGILELMDDPEPSPSEATTGSQGLLNALKGQTNGEADVVDVESQPVETSDPGEGWTPSPEELAEIEARDLREAGLFPEGAA